MTIGIDAEEAKANIADLKILDKKSFDELGIAF